MMKIDEQIREFEALEIVLTGRERLFKAVLKSLETLQRMKTRSEYRKEIKASNIKGKSAKDANDLKTGKRSPRHNMSDSTESMSFYQSALAHYMQWHECFTGVPIKMDARQGKALKSILSHLKEVAKEPTDEGAAKSWVFILAHFYQLNDFLKSQTSLYAIEKNLTEILVKLRNGSTGKERGERATAIGRQELLSKLQK